MRETHRFLRGMVAWEGILRSQCVTGGASALPAKPSTHSAKC